MSTILYYRCVTHDPHISSDEVGRWIEPHLAELQAFLRDRAIIVANMTVLLDDVLGPCFKDSRTAERHSFVYRHRNCEIEIWDEYGRQHPTVSDSDAQAVLNEETIMRPGPHPLGSGVETTIEESAEVAEPTTADEHVAYVRKPDEIKAVQWDGTIEGAVAVSKFLKEHQRNDNLIIHQQVYDGAPQRLYMTVTLRRDEERIYPTEWFVKEQGEHIQHMSPDEFERQYTKKES